MGKTNYIILFVLHTHCSHLLQPLDVNFHGPFEKACNSACHVTLGNLAEVQFLRYDACKITCKVYAAALSPAKFRMLSRGVEYIRTIH